MWRETGPLVASKSVSYKQSSSEVELEAASLSQLET